MIIRLPIDLKSLYFNIKNDNESGHTATVATPLKQYGGVNEELIKILDIPENISRSSKEGLVGQLLAKSRAEAKIKNVFVFDNIAVNGMSLENVPQFCIYIREETAQNYVHCGRQKVHYPTSLRYSDNEIEINNKVVMQAISSKLNDYAFIVEAFEYDTITKVLNFDAIIVGYNQIPYSKVFINRRGVGDKFASVFSDEVEMYDSEIIALREKMGYQNVGPENFSEVMNNNKSVANKLAKKHLEEVGATNIRELISEYPYALYDYEFKLNGRKYYYIVRFTSTHLVNFNLSGNKIQFCNAFSDVVRICFISDINGIPKIQIYTIDAINDMKKAINSICYTGVEE